MRFDLNCDLGENEPRSRTRALLRCVTSANIACGGHAGDLESMRFAVQECLRNKVHIGAHPGYPDRAGFGRVLPKISPAEFQTIVLQQVSALERVATGCGARLHHIKLHGALYHLVERKAAFRRAYLNLVHQFWPSATLYSLANGHVAAEAQKSRLRVWSEGFLDRAYLKSTDLVPREQPGAILSVRQFKARLLALTETGRIDAPAKSFYIQANTWCVHSDSPRSVSLARLARAAFSRA